MPHRVVIAPIVELPFGEGKTWGERHRLVDSILGGWTLSTAINLQSGFPLNIQQTDNTGTFAGVQRPNIVPGVDLSTPGSFEDRLASARSPRRDLDQPGRVHGRAGVHLRQRAADDYRAAFAGAVTTSTACS